jgi:hypothetical protein
MKNVTAQSIPVAAPSHTETTASNQPLPVEQEPHHRWEFQNQYVRVLDVLLAPGESTLFHTHSHDSIAVRLSEATSNYSGAGIRKELATCIEGNAG